MIIILNNRKINVFFLDIFTGRQDKNTGYEFFLLVRKQ